jgi:hypothetical protein
VSADATPDKGASIRIRAQACGFTVLGWDLREGAIRHTDSGYEHVGSHDEIWSFLLGWESARDAMALDHLNAERAIQAAILGMCVHNGRIRNPVGGRLDGGLVPGRTTVEITSHPQIAFRGSRVAIPDVIAPYYDIEDIIVSSRSCFVQAGKVPAVAFATRIADSAVLFARVGQTDLIDITISERALTETGRAISMPTCQAGQVVQIIVTNKTDEPQPFECYVIGRTARYNAHEYLGQEHADEIARRWQTAVSNGAAASAD